MQKTAGIFYTIGKVFNIIEIVFIVLMALVAAYGVANSEQLYQELINQGVTDIASAAELATLCTTLLVSMIVALVLSVLILVFGTKAKKALGNGDKKPQIIVLVFAILAGGIFYLIASIMGLVLACSKPQTPQVQNTTEQQ